MLGTEMNRVQRRLWRSFVSTGVDTEDPTLVRRLRRLLDDHVRIMTPALRHVMQSILFAPGDVDYEKLAAEISALEGTAITPTALRKRVSRSAKMLERAIQEARWDLPRGRSGPGGP
jgi:hypothetical protein